MARRTSALRLVSALLLLTAACGRLGFSSDDASSPADGGGMDAAVAPDRDGGVDVPVCGDGIVEGLELCDDGNTADGDECSGDCSARTVCGDGLVDPGEACDDGNATPNDGCEADCTASCTIDEDCDDGELCNGDEACLTGDADLPTCRDGIPAADGTMCAVGSGCRSGSCAPASCGDGVVDAGEDCDDMNTVDGDGCDNDCSFTCIVGIDDTCPQTPCRIIECQPTGCVPIGSLSAGLPCDRDGDPMTRDICTDAGCVRSLCGDGLVDPMATPPEECDDANTTNGDGCDNDCTFSCATDTSCDDREPCNGVETCATDVHVCVPGVSLTDGTRCALGTGVIGTCSGGRCIRAMIRDSGPAPVDAGPGDAGGVDTGTCPAPPTRTSPDVCFQVGCVNHGDCVLRMSDCCCDCSMGGTSAAILAAYTTLWDLHVRDGCPRACIMMCPTTDTCGVARCIGGICDHVTSGG